MKPRGDDGEVLRVAELRAVLDSKELGPRIRLADDAATDGHNGGEAPCFSSQLLKVGQLFLGTDHEDWGPGFLAFRGRHAPDFPDSSLKKRPVPDARAVLVVLARDLTMTFRHFSGKDDDRGRMCKRPHIDPGAKYAIKLVSQRQGVHGEGVSFRHLLQKKNATPGKGNHVWWILSSGEENG